MSKKKSARELQASGGWQHKSKTVQALRLAEQTETDLIDRIPDDFPATRPGVPDLPPLLGPGSEKSWCDELFMDVRRYLITKGKICLGDTRLMESYASAIKNGQHRYRAALELLVHEREAFLQIRERPRMPLAPYKPEPLPEGDDGAIQCPDDPTCVPFDRKCVICKEVADMVAQDHADDEREYPQKLREHSRAMKEWRHDVAAWKSEMDRIGQ